LAHEAAEESGRRQVAFAKPALRNATQAREAEATATKAPFDEAQGRPAEQRRLKEIEEEVDEAAGELWGITGRELEVIKKGLRRA